jgi:hypothetical protein
MANLTRIKNNQITDSTILANIKIVPGSIVGSLFNSNLTMSSDVTIAGNLTVYGASTYLTVASTNTYVNDPLIVLNNAFTGTNTYDIGFLFNRGNQLSTALSWNEANKEFRLSYTAETGTTYGAISVSSYANLHIGNLTVDYVSTIGSLSTTGNIAANYLTLTGDIEVNGGDITTTASSFNLLNSGDPVTVNAFGVATNLTIGATTGTASLRNANIYLPNATTLYSGQTTLSVANEVPTTVNAFGVATNLTIGATSGTASLRNANIYLPNATTLYSGQTTLSVANEVPTTVNAFGAATTLTIGATTGTANIRNANIYLPNATTLYSGQTTLSVANEVPTTVNAFGSATSLTVGDTTGTASLRNANIWLPNATTIDGASTTVNILTQNATTVSAFTKATAANIGAGSGTITINNPTLVGQQATQDLYNTVATTMNFAGAATSLTIGATTGTLTLRNAIVTTPGQIISTLTGGAANGDGQIYLNGNTSNRIDWRTVGTGAPAFTTRTAGTKLVLYPALSGSQVDYAIGIDSSTLWNSIPVNSDSFNFKWYGGETLVANLSGTGNFTTIGNLAVNGGNLTTTSGTFNLVNNNATTVNAFGDATLVVTGATTGTYNIRNANLYLPNATTIFSGQTTLSFANTVTTSLSIGGEAATFNLGSHTGTTNILGNTTIQSTSNPVNYQTGAFVVNGGAGFAKDVYIAGNLYVANVFSTIASTLVVNAPLLYLEAANAYPYSYDIGFFSHYIGGPGNTYVHTGLVRNESDNAWHLFTNVAEPSLGQVSFVDAEYDKLILGNLLLKNSSGIVTDQTSVDVVNTTATTVNLAGAATTLTVGATTGTATLRNANIYLPNATTIFSGQTTLSFANTVATSINAFGSATTLNFSSGTGSTTIRNSTTSLGILYANSATSSTSTTTGGLVVAGGVGIGGNAYVSKATISLGGSISTGLFAGDYVDGIIFDYSAGLGRISIGLGDGLSIYNNGLATDLLLSISAVGDTEVTGNLQIDSNSLTTTQSTFNILDTGATTVNAFGEATTLTVGATTGTANIRNANIYLPNATTIFSSQTTLSVANEVPTTVNAFGAATALTVGEITGTASIRNANIVFQNATTFYSGQSTVSLFNNNVTTIDMFGGATDIEVGQTTGTFKINNPEVLGSQATQAVFDTNATTINAFGAATSVVTGATTGTYNIRNANIYLPNATTIFSGQTTLSFANTVSATVDAFGSATTLNFSSGTGSTTIRNSTTSLGILYANSATLSTSTTTGGLVVAGGVGIGGNIWVANGAVINSGQTGDNFTVRGAFTTSMIYADSNTGAVVIGGSNVSIQGGTTLKVNSTDSMMVPVGTTGQRPGLSGNVDVIGMVRYNSSVSTVEYYNGTSWASVTGGFTVINSDQFSGNGVANVFSLGGNVTTEGALVSINGTIQSPTLAYAISGNVLTFSESPAVGDLIDVRRMTTTSTVSSIQTGYASVSIDINSANVFTGTSSSIQRINVDGGGNVGLVNGAKLTFDQTATTVGTSAVIIDSFDITKYRSAKYICQFTSQVSGFEVTEILVVQNGSAVTIYEYGKISTTGVNLAVYTTSLSGGAVNILCAGVANTTNLVKISATYIAV